MSKKNSCEEWHEFLNGLMINDRYWPLADPRNFPKFAIQASAVGKSSR